MKLNAYILQKDNSIIKRVITNPSESFDVDYKVDGKDETFTYEFDRTCVFKIKKFFGMENICFYEHATVKPLSASFKSDANVVKDMNKLLESKLLSSLVDSTKKKGMEMSIGLVLGLAGILGVVLIVVFG